VGTRGHRGDGLIRLVLAPSIWATHFLACYAAVAIVCAKVAGRTGTIAGARPWLLGLTAIALAAIGWIGLQGWRAHRHGGGRLPHDEDTPADRRRFLGLATFLLATLSAVAIAYTTLAIVLAGSCR